MIEPIDENGQITVSPIFKLGLFDAAVALHQLTPKLVTNEAGASRV